MIEVMEPWEDYEPSPCPLCQKTPLEMVDGGVGECRNSNCSVLQFDATRNLTAPESGSE